MGKETNHFAELSRSKREVGVLNTQQRKIRLRVREMSAVTKDQSAKQAEAPVQNDATDLNQIRDILLGSFAKEMEHRFEQLSSKMGESLDDLRAVIIQRTDSISGKLEKEVESLHKDLDSYRTESGKSTQSLQQKLSSAKNDFQQQLGALGQTLAASELNLRQETDQGLADMKEQIKEQLTEIRQRMDTELSRLDDATVTRRSFRDALRELSIQFDSEDSA